MAEEPNLWRDLWRAVVGRLPEPVAGLPEWVLLLIAAGVVALALLALLLILVFVLRLVLGRGRGRARGQGSYLEEHLGTYPPAPPGTGDRRLTVEGVPVRLRLVVVAPSGTESEVDTANVEALLDRVVPGLAQIVRQDKPRVRLWPTQFSYEGFAHQFHSSTVTPEPEGELSQWVVVAGRAKVGKQQVMVGLALQAPKPTTLGRMTLQTHEWEARLRVRVRDGG